MGPLLPMLRACHVNEGEKEKTGHLSPNPSVPLHPTQQLTLMHQIRLALLLSNGFKVINFGRYFLFVI